MTSFSSGGHSTMNVSKFKEIWPLKKTENELERTPLVDSKEMPFRRICKIPTKEIESAGEGSRQNRGPGETSRQTNSSNNVKAIVKLEESLPRFGPLYGADHPFLLNAKDNAWNHVLRKSSGKEAPVKEEEVGKKISEPDNPQAEREVNRQSRDMHNNTEDIYVTALRRVEQEAKERYVQNESAVGPDLGDDFHWVLIKDGCFFLQLALLILGSEELGYLSKDLIFGNEPNKEVNKYIKAMFHVGNQIPLVVLKVLMNQNFFQDVIRKGKWNPCTSDLYKKVLYEVLVLPALKRDHWWWWLYLKERVMGRGNIPAVQQSSDVLHALQNLVLGPDPPGHLSSKYEADGQIDLEANEEEIGGYETIFPSSAIDDGSDRIRINFSASGFPDAVDTRKRIFPSATELKRAGISIKKLKSGGVRSIHFKSFYLWAFLYLPAFPVDDNTEMVFRNLKTYEISQQLGKNRREISSYLRVMSDIVRTTKDAKVLQKKGIIEGNDSDSDNVEKLPGILSRLSSEEDIRLTNGLRNVRRLIRDYSSPLIQYKGVLNVIGFLTLIQTLFTLLAYFRPSKP